MTGRPALLDIDVPERRDQAATTRATVVMEGNPFAVAVGELRVTLVDDGLAVFVTNGLVALAGKRAPHEVETFGAASDFATVFQLVALTDGRFHFGDATYLKRAEQASSAALTRRFP